MEEEHYDFDLDPVSFITVGVVGPPGQRTFFLQAARGTRVVSLIIEKEHAAALAVSVRRLLEAVEEAEGDAPPKNLDLLQPVEPKFRVGQLGIGILEERSMIVLEADELTTEDETGARARFVATFAQMAALAQHAVDMVNAGRPVCELCGEPIDPEGHYCPRRNGHPPPLE